MRPSTLLILAALAASASCTSAGAPSTPAATPGIQPLPPQAVAVPVPAGTEVDQALVPTQARYDALRQLATRAAGIKEGKERLNTLDEHLKKLGEAMDAVMAVNGGKLMLAPKAGGMGPGAVMAPLDVNAPNYVAARVQRLEQRVETLTLVLDQLVAQERLRLTK